MPCHLTRQSPGLARTFALASFAMFAAVSSLLMSCGQSTQLKDQQDEARIAKALSDIKTLSKAVMLFAMEDRRLPDSLDDVAKKLGQIPHDPWGNAYRYVRIGPTDFDITCLGSDGEVGGEGLAADLNRESTRE